MQNLSLPEPFKGLNELRKWGNVQATFNKDKVMKITIQAVGPFLYLFQNNSIKDVIQIVFIPTSTNDISKHSKGYEVILNSVGKIFSPVSLVFESSKEMREFQMYFNKKYSETVQYYEKLITNSYQLQEDIEEVIGPRETKTVKASIQATAKNFQFQPTRGDLAKEQAVSQKVSSLTMVYPEPKQPLNKSHCGLLFIVGDINKTSPSHTFLCKTVQDMMKWVLAIFIIANTPDAQLKALTSKQNASEKQKKPKNNVDATQTIPRSTANTDKTVASRYILKEEIGKGSFGVIFLGEHIVSHEMVAIKLEPVEKQSLQLKNESKIYKVLAGCPGIPELFWFGTEGQYNVLVMEYLGSSLEFEMMRHNQQLSLKTVLMFADQAICLIQYMHERHFIHRDIKPENFLIGSGKKSNLIYLIDFGLSKKYRDPKTKEHIPYRGDKELVGTSRYVSINTHLGIEQSRRDDLESLGYVLVYLLKGQLPWQGIQSENLKQKYEKIGEKKMTTSFDMLCQDLPEEFIKYFEIVRALDFTQEPPYSQLRQIFKDCFLKHDFVYDYKYDWSNGNDKETCKNYDPVPMHAPIFKDHEAGLEILPKNERNHPNFRYATPNIENNRIQQITERLTTVKARTAITNKRVWVDPGKRQTFPRGPPPIPAKMLPPPKKKGRLSRTTQLAQETFSLLVSPTSSLRQSSQSQNKFDVASTTPSLASDNIQIHPNTAPEPVKTLSLDAPYQPEEIPEDDED